MDLGVKQALEVLGKDPPLDFEMLLDPYREGGMESAPIKRTWSLILEWLMARHRCPIETAGAAILLVILELKNGKSFEGDGSYGSRGVQLDRYILDAARKIERRKDQSEFFAVIGASVLDIAGKREAKRLRKRLKPWWKFW